MVRFLDVSKEYKSGTRALNGVSFTISDGEMAFLVGPSGSGKSTIIRLINGETKPTSGKIMVNGYNLTSLRRSDIPYMRRTLGVIFQDFRLLEKKTVYDNVAFAMRVIGAPRRHIAERVPYALELVGLTDCASRMPDELSGGEQQRVAIARALVNSPRMIIADEPTGNLDPARSVDIMRLLEKINSLGTTVMVVTHEKALVDSMSKRVIAIDSGCIVSDGTGGYFGYEE
ncbi:MAG: cell division ATP-binding protein FtsE [Oscillospiraceae bacterium]|nr:cell division ATP-binding protein FtsE [Oscillospiraceae bacterium]